MQKHGKFGVKFSKKNIFFELAPKSWPTVLFPRKYEIMEKTQNLFTPPLYFTTSSSEIYCEPSAFPRS